MQSNKHHLGVLATQLAELNLTQKKLSEAEDRLTLSVAGDKEMDQNNLKGDMFKHVGICICMNAYECMYMNV
jgi:hypothetical protein